MRGWCGNTCCITFLCGLGGKSNNWVELKVMALLLSIALGRDLRDFQGF